MKATDTLRNEHEAVRLMLEIMDSAAAGISAENKIRTADIDDIIDFLKIFVDKCHHGKEEHILFPKLEESGIPREGGPIGVMLAEHEQGRAFIRNMSSAIADYKNGVESAAASLAENIGAYNELLRGHIDKENNVLFEMADSVLSEEVQDILFDRFEELEENVIGAGTHEKLHKRLETLSEYYLGQ
jgi:hemerythrin-like domain-containing protein